MDKQKRKIIRVYVTERCNANCQNCFNSNSRSNKEMSISDFLDLCIYLRENKFNYLKIMGGEPTIHNNFMDIIKIAQNYFPGISIFTNGLNEIVKEIPLRDTDSIIYNFNFNKTFTKDRIFNQTTGRKAFEIQVKKDTDEVFLVKRIFELIEDKEVGISLTLDCTANIFKEKAIVLPKLKYIETELMKKSKSFSYDHKLPLCYLYKTGLHFSNTHKCTIKDAGLIGADFTVKFCNQHTESLINLKRGDNFLPWPLVENYIKKTYYEIQLEALNNYCQSCIFFENKCNGGCWIPKKSISKEDILMNTSFPIK